MGCRAVPSLRGFVLRGRVGFCWAGGYVWLRYRLWRCRPKAGDAVRPGGCIFVQVELQRWWSNRVPLAWVVVRGVVVDALLSGRAVVAPNGVRDGGVLVVLERVVGPREVFERGANSRSQRFDVSVWQYVIPCCTGVVSGGPVCPSRTSVSYLVQSCNIRSTYAASVYGWILCSARVRVWASCLYRVQCRGAGLGGGIAAGSGVGFLFSIALLPCRVACTGVCSSSLRSGVHSRSASPVDALVGRHVAVCAQGGAFCHAGRWCGPASSCAGLRREPQLIPRGLLAVGRQIPG